MLFIWCYFFTNNILEVFMTRQRYTFTSHALHKKMVVPAPQYIVTARLYMHFATRSEHACMQSVVCKIYYSFSYHYKSCVPFSFTKHAYTYTL